MAAAAVMVSSPSSLLGGEISANQAEKSIEESKPESSEPKSDPIVQAGDDSPKDEAGNNIKVHVKQESSTEPSTEKPVEFSDTTKKPPRMSSIDEYTRLPEGYVPKDEDVICSWARQNVSRTCTVGPVQPCFR